MVILGPAEWPPLAHAFGVRKLGERSGNGWVLVFNDYRTAFAITSAWKASQYH
jgi:hypothetical protein